MTREEIKSVGIDIGTSTTQLVFSKLVIVNLAGIYSIPRISIVEKEVIYKSDIYFTPLKSKTEIDSEKVKEIIQKEYRKAGIGTNELSTGAVIITGETARKKNATEVLSALSNLAGEFVVATAGPDLESVLAAKGAGADQVSEENQTVTANLDIGGGTSNIAVYERGELRGVCCLDIGGRLIKIENGRITYIFHKIEKLAAEHGISIREGETADVQKLLSVCRLMASQLAQALHKRAADNSHSAIYTNGGAMLSENPEILSVTFSGGVADCIYGKIDMTDPFKYGDIGILLGKAISEDPDLKKLKVFPAKETIRATVVGAGTHATNVSGSTIRYDKELLPMKNIPVLKIPESAEERLETFTASIKKQLPMYISDGQIDEVAIAFNGKRWNRYKEVQELADAIMTGARDIVESNAPVILIMENDIGRALGNAMKMRLPGDKALICIDRIHAAGGDYIDIGEPIAGGQVLPIVNKTLVFNT